MRNLGISAGLPFTSFEVFTLQTHNANRGEVFPFPVRRGWRPRYLVRAEAVTNDALWYTPESSTYFPVAVTPSGAQLAGYSVTLRDPRGEYLWRDVPASTLTARPGGDAQRRPRYAERLLVDWSRSYVRVLTGAQPVSFVLACYFDE